MRMKNSFSVNQHTYQRNSAGAPTKSGRVVGGLSSTRGVSLLLTVLIMSVILAIGLGLSAILIQQTKMMGGIGYSVVAFFAADNGIEEILMASTTIPIPETTLPNGAKYEVFVNTSSTDPNCTTTNYCLKSIGTYKETKRAIEIKY